jgi:hypothetical protein
MVVDNGERLYDNLSLYMLLPSDDLPKTVDVCGAEVGLDLKSDSSEGVLSDSSESKSILQNVIKSNSECTGFLMWLPCFCISCIFKPK